MSSLTIDRLNSIFEKEIALILQNDLKNSKIGFVTITEVRIRKDLNEAVVFYSIIGDEERVKVCQEALDKSVGFIKTELSKRIKQIRKIPNLVFKYDTSLSYGNKIHKILEEIKK